MLNKDDERVRNIHLSVTALQDATEDIDLNNILLIRYGWKEEMKKYWPLRKTWVEGNAFIK